MAAESKITKLPFSTHFVLVHGASHGGWCWYKIRCLLESIGQKVSCPDLASSGIDPIDADTIFTFEEYNKPLHDILASLPINEKVILVGHSAGGLSLTDAIHNFVEKIHVAVFVGAHMLRKGFQRDQGNDELKRNNNMLGCNEIYECSYGQGRDNPPTSVILKRDAQRQLLYQMSPLERNNNMLGCNEIYECSYGQGRDNPPTSVILKRDAQRQLLYQMSPLEDCTLAAMLLRPCPTKALSAAIFPDDKDCDKVPRVYIKTMHDNVFSLEYQDSMIKNWPPSDVFTIDSDHCPMFSNPSQLFGLLVRIASEFGDH